jgi:SAM-dependent methyltransferase
VGEENRALLRRLVAGILQRVQWRWRRWVDVSPSTRDPRLIRYLIQTRGLRSLKPSYDACFYEEYQAAGVGYARLAHYINEWAHPRSVCDFGCGNGAILCYFAQRGMDVMGVEGSKDALEHIPPDIRGRIVLADLSKPGQFGSHDLVTSVEVAEHIPKRAAHHFVDNVARTARGYVFLTAASPGQWGEGHINCQPQEYWINLFEERGWRYDRPATASFTQRVQRDETIAATLPWIRRNVMLFQRGIAQKSGTESGG